MIHLPFDIIAYWVTFLRDDPGTLITCASLNRLWHQACRPHIFQRIVVDVRKHTSDPLIKLEKFLDSDRSIGPLVQELRLSFLISDRERGNSYESWICDVPRLLLTRLPYVHSLEIVGLGLPMDDFPATFYEELQQLVYIKRLSLVYCCTLYDVLNGFVSNLPNLTELHIHSQWLATRTLSQDDFDLDRIPLPRNIPKLKTFYYHNDDATGPSTLAFLEWIRPIKTLKSIGFHIDRDVALKDVAQFLRERGGSLEQIEIRFLDRTDYWEWDEAHPEGNARRKVIQDHFDLKALKNIQTLHIHTVDHVSGAPFLAQVAPSRPQRIVITDTAWDLDACDKSGGSLELDDILSSPAFEYLHEILFIYRGIIQKKDSVQKFFPKLHSQDKIRFLWAKADTDLCCLL